MREEAESLGIQPSNEQIGNEKRRPQSGSRLLIWRRYFWFANSHRGTMKRKRIFRLYKDRPLHPSSTCNRGGYRKFLNEYFSKSLNFLSKVISGQFMPYIISKVHTSQIQCCIRERQEFLFFVIFSPKEIFFLVLCTWLYTDKKYSKSLVK